MRVKLFIPEENKSLLFFSLFLFLFEGREGGREGGRARSNAHKHSGLNFSVPGPLVSLGHIYLCN
jgi:hypothetical protein